jgi:hypothetical protein
MMRLVIPRCKCAHCSLAAAVSSKVMLRHVQEVVEHQQAPPDSPRRAGRTARGVWRRAGGRVSAAGGGPLQGRGRRPPCPAPTAHAPARSASKLRRQISARRSAAYLVSMWLRAMSSHTCKHMQRKHQVGCQPRTSAAAKAAAGCCGPLPAPPAAPRCAAASRAAGRLRLPRSVLPAARLLQWRRLPQQACLIVHVVLALHHRMQQDCTTMCTLISVTVSLPELAFQWLPVVWADLRAAAAACEQPAFPGAPPQLAELRSSRCPVAQPTPEPAQPPLGLQPSRGLGTPQPAENLLQHPVGCASAMTQARQAQALSEIRGVQYR